MTDRRPAAVLCALAILAAGAVIAAADLARTVVPPRPRGGAPAGLEPAPAPFDRVTGGLGAGTALRFDGLSPMFDARLAGGDAQLGDPVSGGPDASPPGDEP